METTRTYWPGEADISFDVVLIDAISDYIDQPVMELPAIGDDIDLDAVTALLQAETRTTLAFDVDVPGMGMGVDGEPATSVTVTVETEPYDPVHITVTEANRDPGRVGAAPQIW